MWKVESFYPNTDKERKASVTVRTYGDTIDHCEIMKECLCFL